MKKAGNGMPFVLMGWIASGHRRMLDTALPQTLLYALMLSRMRLPNGKHKRPTGRAGIQIEQPSHDILETFKRAVVLVGTCLRRSRTCMWVVDFLNSNRLEAQAGAPYWKTVGVGVTGEVRDYFRIITINPSRLSVACVL